MARAALSLPVLSNSRPIPCEQEVTREVVILATGTAEEVLDTLQHMREMRSTSACALARAFS